MSQANDSLYELMIVRFKKYDCICMHACLRTHTLTLCGYMTSYRQQISTQDMPVSKNNREQFITFDDLAVWAVIKHTSFEAVSCVKNVLDCYRQTTRQTFIGKLNSQIAFPFVLGLFEFHPKKRPKKRWLIMP